MKNTSEPLCLFCCMLRFCRDPVSAGVVPTVLLLQPRRRLGLAWPLAWPCQERWEMINPFVTTKPQREHLPLFLSHYVFAYWNYMH